MLQATDSDDKTTLQLPKTKALALQLDSDTKQQRRTKQHR